MKGNRARFINFVFNRLLLVLKKIAQPLFFLLGLALLVWTVKSVGLAELGRTFSLLKGPGAVCLFFYPLVSFWDAWGWHYTFPKPVRSQVTVWDLFWVRLAGEAMNNLTPFADLGGEPLKIRLLKIRFGLEGRAAAAGVILAKSVLFYSETLYWIVGLIPAFALTSLPDDWKRAFGAVFLGCILFTAGLLAFQLKGFFRVFSRFYPGLKSKEKALSEMDGLIRSFYTSPGSGFVPSFALHFIGWLFGGLETWLMLTVMGTGIGLGESLALEALFQMTRTATFFIPGSLGVQEAGMAVYFSAFGHAAPAGVALSLLKRARQLLWSAAGLGVWGFYEWQARRLASQVR